MSTTFSEFKIWILIRWQQWHSTVIFRGIMIWSVILVHIWQILPVSVGCSGRFKRVSSCWQGPLKYCLQGPHQKMKNRSKGPIVITGGGSENLFFIFFFYLSLLEITEICFMSTNVKVFSRWQGPTGWIIGQSLDYCWRLTSVVIHNAETLHSLAVANNLKHSLEFHHRSLIIISLVRNMSTNFTKKYGKWCDKNDTALK